MTAIYLDVGRVLRLHELVIRQSGGSIAVLQPNLLDSAVAQPSMRFSGEDLHPDIPSKAAAYLFHICMNHPFEDGNKRTAHVTAEVFLMMNGYALTGTVDELEQFTVGVAAGTISKDEAIGFFRAHASPLEIDQASP